MSWFYRHLVRPALFRRDPEQIHDSALGYLSRLSKDARIVEAIGSFFEAPELPVNLWGLSFPNPLGIAAGLDKAALALPIWQSLGFGFTELGGVTCHAQVGNPKPRLFRVQEAEGLINRMGFNNPGAEAVAKRLEEWRSKGLWPGHPVGLNLGKSRTTPLSEAAGDYAASFETLWRHGDFFVVNVSSPNTPGLTGLQEKGALEEILAAIQQVNRRRAALGLGRTKPVLVKVSPDLSFAGLDELLEIAGPAKIAGIVATNTSVSRPALAAGGPPGASGDPLASDPTSGHPAPSVYSEAGGLSGRPLRSRSTEVIRHLFRQTGGGLPIIGVGGIFTGDDAWEKIAAGASLLQLYTGLIYEGPTVASRIVARLRAILSEKGFPDLRSAIGSETNGGDR